MTHETTTDSAAELKPIRIFVCSSGDMIAERQAALRVIETLNRTAHGAARSNPIREFLQAARLHCWLRGASEL